MFLVVLIGIALAWEVAALAGYLGPAATISESFWSVAERPLVPFLFGGLAGHFVFQRQTCKRCGGRPW